MHPIVRAAAEADLSSGERAGLAQRRHAGLRPMARLRNGSQPTFATDPAADEWVIDSLRAAGLAEGGRRGIELLRPAVCALEHCAVRLEHARAMTDLGAALRRAGQRADRREILRPALDLAHRCGSLALTERTRTELIAAGGRPRRLVLTGLDSLTPSERRVTQLVAAGLRDQLPAAVAGKDLETTVPSSTLGGALSPAIAPRGEQSKPSPLPGRLSQSPSTDLAELS